MACAVAVMACVRADDRAAKTTTLTAHDAIDIYLAKASRSARDSLTSVLSKRYNITMKAVRDVWNLRTWKWTTMPYWTRSDLAKFLRKHLCTQCQRKGVTSLASAFHAPSAQWPGFTPNNAVTKSLKFCLFSRCLPLRGRQAFL